MAVSIMSWFSNFEALPATRITWSFSITGSGKPFESDTSSSSSPRTCWESVKHGVDVFCRFSKLYVIIPKTINVFSISLLAIDKLSDFSPFYFNGVLKAMVAAVFMTMYNVGLNHLTDIEIDRVNKPNRPLVSGELSYQAASLIVTFCAISGFGIAWAEGSWPLFGVIFSNFLLGTIYSVNLPLLRWKRFPFLAAACIVSLWGIIQPVCFYLHFQMHFLHKPYNFPKSLTFTSVVLVFFSMILALAKDIPDVEGDAKHGVHSYAMRLGQKRVFWICVILLEMVYGAAIGVGAMSAYLWSKLIMIIGHSVVAVLLWNRAKQTDMMNREAGEAFYMFLLKLFQAEFMLIPFIRF